MISKFNEIYAKIYKENYEELEKLRKKERNRQIIQICMITIAIILVACIFLRPKLIILFGLLLMIIVLIVITLGKPTWYKKEYKQKVIRNLVKTYDENLEYKPYSGISQIEYRSGEFERYDRYYSEDTIEGIINDMVIKMAEVHTEEEYVDDEGHRSYTTVFHGMFGIVKLSQFIAGTIKIHSDKGLFGKIFKGKNKVEMDSSEFEKYFDIYADNKIQAMQILTSDVMTEMIRFYEKYKIKYEMTIKQDTLYIRFKCGPMFEANLMKSSLDMDTLKRNYDIINFIFNISQKIANTINQKQL